MESAPIALATARLVLREFVPNDWVGFLDMTNDPDIAQVLHIDESHLVQERQNWFVSALTNQQERFEGNYNWGCVLTETGEFVGWIGIGDSERRERPGDRSMGYVIVRRFWNRGLMTEALQAVLQYEFTVLGTSRVTVTCATSNRASERVMQKAGMRYIRTIADPDPLNGQIVERHHYALEQHEWMAHQGR